MPKIYQARAQRTVHALLAAAAEVFSKNGFDTTQTPDIAQAAGVSVGTFYRYFSDKRAIFIEVISRELERTHAEVMAKLLPARFGAHAERRESIAQALAIVFDHIAGAARLMRVLEEVALRDSVVAKLRRKFEDETRAPIAALIAEVTTRTEVPDPEATACVLHTAVIGTAVAQSGAHGKPPIARDRALRALTDLVYRACFTDR